MSMEPVCRFIQDPKSRDVACLWVGRNSLNVGRMETVRSIFLIPDENRSLIYSDAAINRIQEMTRNDGRCYNKEEILSNPENFGDVEIIFSGWGAPVLDDSLLSALPALRAFFYGAGSVRAFVTDAFWERGIVLTSAYKSNAIPVAEFTVAMVNISLKQVWSFNRAIRSGANKFDKSSIPGMYAGTKAGIISLGAIGQLVARSLSEKGLDVYAYDPFAKEEIFTDCGAVQASSLEWLFKNCEVVSLHAPNLPETENLITGEHFRLMQSGATFINTARGMIVDEPAMIEVFSEREDIYAVIDVIRDERFYGSNPLGQLPNVFMTPHIAGSTGRECHRMGDSAVEECRRFLSGEPQLTGIDREKARLLA